jgi:hypothetical protein
MSTSMSIHKQAPCHTQPRRCPAGGRPPITTSTSRSSLRAPCARMVRWWPVGSVRLLTPCTSRWWPAGSARPAFAPSTIRWWPAGSARPPSSRAPWREAWSPRIVPSLRKSPSCSTSAPSPATPLTHANFPSTSCTRASTSSRSDVKHRTPFLVTHFDADRKYNPECFHESKVKHSIVTHFYPDIKCSHDNNMKNDHSHCSTPTSLSTSTSSPCCIGEVESNIADLTPTRSSSTSCTLVATSSRSDVKHRTPFRVTHFDADKKYNPECFHESKVKPCTVTHFDADMRCSYEDKMKNDHLNCPTTTSLATSTSSACIIGEVESNIADLRVPHVFLKLLDDWINTVTVPYVSETLDMLYDATSFHSFWDGEGVDRILSALLQERYPHVKWKEE